MIDHGRCRRARYVAPYDHDEVADRWECSACSETLGSAYSEGNQKITTLVEGLVERPVRHGELRAYGLANRARLQGKLPRGTGVGKDLRALHYHSADGPTVKIGGRHGTECYVYCPRCGAGQHVLSLAE